MTTKIKIPKPSTGFTFVGVWRDETIEPVLMRHIEAFHAKDFSISTNWCDRIPDSEQGQAVRDLAQGEVICKALGHSFENVPRVTLEYDPSLIGDRKCRICGLKQSLHAGEWK